MIHTISVSSRAVARGPLVEQLADGRVTIEAGGQQVTGYPVSPRANRVIGWHGLAVGAVAALTALAATAPGASADTTILNAV